MPGNKYTEKQMKIARVAEPRDSITGADFEALRNSKMAGGMVKYNEGGDVRREMLLQMLSDARENNDDDKIIEIEAELFQILGLPYMFKHALLKVHLDYALFGWFSCGLD